MYSRIRYDIFFKKIFTSGDVITDIRQETEIKQRIHMKEVQDAFEQLDISDLTNEEIRELQFQEAMEEYQEPFERHMKRMEQKKMREVAQKMLSIGIDAQDVCKATDLGEREIESLRSPSK